MSEPRNLQNRVAAAFDDERMSALEVGPLTGAGMLATIHDALGDITVCRNLDDVILAANTTFRDLVGVENPEGRTCTELGIAFKYGPKPHSFEVEFNAGASPRIFLWHDVLMRDPLLGVLVIQSVAREITEERRQAARNEEALRKAEEESLRKSRLIAMVSHEIRTPLSGLLGMGQLLAGTPLNPEQKNYLEGIRQSGTALVHLVEDLLDFATLSARRFHLRPRAEPIRPLIEGVVEMLSSRAHAKGIELAAEIAPRIPGSLSFDPGRFRQVLYNVIGNAVKFTEAGGVLVTADLAGGSLEVRVKDTGPGMNAAELQRIFGEFEQGDLHSAREGGVGLGLAISARIMAEAGGAMTVESESGKGTTFIIRMPAGPVDGAMRNGSELAGARVLLLAPDGPAADAIALNLDHLGALVRTAADIAQARAEIEHWAFTDVIVDHRLDTAFAHALASDHLLTGTRKIFLVNPESRPAVMSGDVYDSWLIRPLREQSLIDVLTGRLHGLEPRMPKDEQFPMLSAEPVDDDEEHAPKPLSVLIGEDDPVNAMIVRATLERAGHRVRLATNFARLAALHAEEPAAIILTDNNMPDGTCDTFIGRLRDQEEARGLRFTPVIVLTADSRDEIRHALLAGGANLVLFKPAVPDVLTKAVLNLAIRSVAS